MPEPHRLRTLKEASTPPVLVDAKRFWSAGALVVGILVAGAGLRAFGADLLFGKHAIERFGSIEAKQKLQDDRYRHLDHDIDALHEDVRAMAAHQPLPAWTHEPLEEADPASSPSP